MTSMVERVRRFRRVRALVIGDAMLDTYYEGTAERLCGEGPIPVVRKTAEFHAPGGAANTAANLRALGAHVAYLGVTGADAAGEALRAALCERGVAATRLVADVGTATSHKLRILADGQYVVRFDEGGEGGILPATERALLAHLEDAYPACDVVVISDYGYGAASDTLLARLDALRAARPTPLVVDSKRLARFQALHATVVTPNHLEARMLLSREATTPDEALPGDRRALAAQLAPRLLEMLGCEHVAVTLAGDGVYLRSANGVAAHVPAHPVARASDVGAGDSFTAALALALAAGAEIAEAVRIGIEAAGIAVTKRWTSVVEARELLRRVSLRERSDAATREGGTSRGRALMRVLATLDSARRAGKSVVFTNGIFDILHAGHIELLRQAKALGDVLVVGVNSDRGAAAGAHAGRPINSERDRLALVAALDVVDHALLFDDETPAELIRALRPDIHVKGGDYADMALPEADAVAAGGGRVVILPLAGDAGTGAVIGRILARAADGSLGAVS
jgi:D-beta-D-heptose 7-phosphate kinase/D-beta-D-heptose 1-phosphate adenosyltransferase